MASRPAGKEIERRQAIGSIGGSKLDRIRRSELVFVAALVRRSLKLNFSFHQLLPHRDSDRECGFN